MQEQPYNAYQVKNKEEKENQYESVNEDLLRLREMNAAFAKLNQNYLQQNYEYQSYSLQQTSGLPSYQVPLHQTAIEYIENNHNTERSNSLLFTLSQKDEQQTRPTTNVQNPFYENNTNSQFQVMNSNRFGQFQYEANRSLPVNNTIFQQGITHRNLFDNLNTNPTLKSYYQMENIQPHHANENPQELYFQQKQLQPSGFSKYEEFAIKISRLFNIEVEDLEIIYNQLKNQKETEQQQLQCISQPKQTTEFSDSQVMKKLFAHALQIKDSHVKLKKIINTIDHRKQRTIERPVQYIPTKMGFQNVSINFMLEAQDKLNSHHQKISLKDDRTKRLNRNLIGQRQINQSTGNREMQNIQNKNTIVERHKGAQNQEILSGHTIPSNNSIGGHSANTHTRSHKSKKKSRVSQKIRLISEQLESLKKQIDLQEESSSSQNNFSVKEQGIQNLQKLQNRSNEAQHKPAIQFQNPLNIIQNKRQLVAQSEAYVFGGQKFTYAKSIEEIPSEDQQIKRKIQQTIKNSIVKSPSKKSQQLQQISNQIKKIQNQPNKRRETQKIIVEPASIRNQNKKFSFKQKSFQSLVSQNSQSSISRSQRRQKMFKSIAEIRKSRSKEKNNDLNQNQPIKIQVVKTSNNPYLEENQEFQNRKVQVDDRLISQNSIAPVQKFYSITPSYLSSKSLNDGKLFAQRNEIQPMISRQNIQQYPSQIHISPPTNINSYGYVNLNERNKYPSGISSIQANQIVSLPISNLGFQHQNPARNTISFAQPRSLFSAKTIESKSQIGSERFIKRPQFKQENKIYIPNQTYNPSFQQYNVGSPENMTHIRPSNSRNISNQRFTLHPSVPNLRVLKEKLQQYVRPVTPVNNIENISLPLQRQKQRSFSTQRLQPNRNMIPVGNVGLVQNKFGQVFQTQRENQQFTDQAIKNIQLYTRINERKAPQRALSVPIKAMTPEKKMVERSKQTLLQKHASLPIQQSNLISSIRNQFPQNSQRQNRFQASKPAYQFVSNPIEDSNKGQPRINQQINQLKTPYFTSHISIQTENQPKSPEFIGWKPSAYSASKHQPSQANQVRANPRLEQSEMYYGNYGNVYQIKPNIQDINLIGSKKIQSVVHTFPVQLQQSQKMNNLAYANQQITDRNFTLRPSKQKYGQISTAQAPRIPQNMKPPKCIPPKQLSRNSAQFNNLMHQRQFHNKSLQRQNSFKQYLKPQRPVKTYTMGHLIQASKVQNYMRQTQKSHTALNASNPGDNSDLFGTNLSFGKANEQNSSQTFFINPQFRNLHHLNESRNSSESKSKRSSSSRQRASKKGIALESKKSKAPSHKFIQSSYDR